MAAAAAPADTKMAAAAEEASAMDLPAIAYIQPLEADPQYSSMYLPSYEALPEIVPWPGWPEQAEPPEDWEPLPDLPPIEEVICHPHHLPTVGHFQLCCGPPFPWPKLLGPKKPPDLSEPVREYLVIFSKPLPSIFFVACVYEK
ncbi:hypothetical protein CY35_03G005200 [Sphagnum magellanicum]|nr:hypothetical protein CY35_03G005200 [Sphagnum magellanicum]